MTLEQQELLSYVGAKLVSIPIERASTQEEYQDVTQQIEYLQERLEHLEEDLATFTVDEVRYLQVVKTLKEDLDDKL